jgi:hypothetical protein
MIASQPNPKTCYKVYTCLKVALIPPPTEMLDFPCFSQKGTSPIFALGRVSPSFPTFEGHFGSGFLR